MPTTKAQAATEQHLRVPHLTWGWLLKRSALWVVILATAITSACWLYAAASPDGAQDHGAANTPTAGATGT